MANMAPLAKESLPAAAIEVTLVRPLPGMAYGLRQPTLILRCGVQPAGEVDWPAVDALTGVAPIGDEPFAAALAGRVLCWAAALQLEAGLPVFEEGCVLDIAEGEGIHQVLIAAPYPPRRSRAALRALHWAADHLGQLVDGGEIHGSDLAAARQEVVTQLKRFAYPSTNTLHFLRAAHERDIPWELITANLYQLGWGKQARWLDSSFTDRTSALGSNMALRKDWTAELLSRVGLPVPRHGLARSEDQAAELAEAIGYPVVVKPADKDGGLGVAANLDSGAKVRAAYAAARKLSKHVLVQEHVPGRDYRLTVSHGRLVWAILRQPGGVTGDGKHNVGELVEQMNAKREFIKKLQLDEEAHMQLKQKGLGLDSVPPPGVFVQLRSAANVTQGGTPIGVMDEVHPDNRRLAEQAAAALRLDLAGIDLLIEDIGKSWLETGAYICEVNAKPQLGITTQQHLYGEILDELLPGGGRIPVAVIIGAKAGAKIAQLIRDHQTRQGATVGVATGEGAWIGGEQMLPSGPGLRAASELLLASQEVDLALVVADGSILKTGLPFDRYDLLVIAGGAQPEGEKWPDAVIQMIEPHNRGTALVNWDAEDCRAIAEAIRPATLQRTTGSNHAIAAAANALLRKSQGLPAKPSPRARKTKSQS
jgi:cyanophycin synthetase